MKLEVSLECVRGMCRACQKCIKRTSIHELSTVFATERTNIDDIVCMSDDIKIMLDDDDGIATIDELGEDIKELGDIGEVESGRGLIEDIECLVRRSLREIKCELDTLSLSTRECRSPLTECDISETDI